jgi:ParB-like chromosome segregation protein Spo0J
VNARVTRERPSQPSRPRVLPWRSRGRQRSVDRGTRRPAIELRNQAALRGREEEGHVELCFGHRRLEAVTSLGWKEVDVEIVKLTDQEMALEALIENMQREGLTDADRGEGIANYIKLKIGVTDLSVFAGSGVKSAEVKKTAVFFNAAREEVGKLVGLSAARVSELLKIAGWDEMRKEPIRKQQIAGKTAVAATRIAGEKDADQAVKAIAEKKVGFRAMEAIGQEYTALPEATPADKAVKEKVRKSFVRGDITQPEEVVTKARQFKGAATRKESMPPDLIDVMREWTERAQLRHVHLGDCEP